MTKHGGRALVLYRLMLQAEELRTELLNYGATLPAASVSDAVDDLKRMVREAREE